MKSVKKIMALMALSAVSVAASGTAFADESEPKNFSVTVGVKAWNADWLTWGGFGAATAVAPIPSVTVKYKNFFVSGGAMTETKYTLPDGYGTTVSASRKEMDLSVGYYIHPQVAVTLGYKETTQIFNYATGYFFVGSAASTDTYKWKIPAVGVSMAAPIQETKMFMYSNAAIGGASISSSSTLGGSVCAGCKGGTYSTAEVGVGYSILPSFRMSLGYKYQVIPTYGLLVTNATTKITQYDTTRGLILGGSYTF